MTPPPSTPLSIDRSTEAFRLLSDATRLRLLLVLEAQPLSAAELTEITGLAQSRVSTHLTRLKRAGLLRDERVGGAALYSTSEHAPALAGVLWGVLRARLDDPQARLDRERAEEVVRRRTLGQSWAESVAGRMEQHYSPGRSWETTARALMTLVELGDVLDLASGDGVLAGLLAGHARSVTCVDVSATVIAAARRRLGEMPNVSFHEGDMHALPFADARFDHVFAMNALSYSRSPAQLVGEAARLLRPGGRLVMAALNRHEHAEAMRAYDHVNLGITPADLRALIEAAGLSVSQCRVTSREPRPPYFEVVTALAQR
jgi:ArsR family transcriptional regulator